jgi:hypothetical protein
VTISEQQIVIANKGKNPSVAIDGEQIFFAYQLKGKLIGHVAVLQQWEAFEVPKKGKF